MKVAVYETMEVTDEQRVEIAALIDGPGGSKRKASAAEMKAWLWQQGADWQSALASGDAEDADDDLIGDEPDPLEDLI